MGVGAFEFLEQKLDIREQMRNPETKNSVEDVRVLSDRMLQLEAEVQNMKHPIEGVEPERHTFWVQRLANTCSTRPKRTKIQYRGFN